MNNIIETKKFQHTIQLLKIELNERDLLLQNQKIHYQEKCEDLQEKLADMTYQKQLLQTKLDSQRQVDHELTLRSQDEVRQQLAQIMERQHQLEDVNKRLIAKSNEIRYNLHNKILPTDEEYRILKSTNINSDQISLNDFIMIKFYETVRPLETEIDNLRRTQNILESKLAANGQDLIQTQKTVDEERRSNHAVQMQLQKITSELNEYKNLCEQFDFKKQNYDRIKSERDQYEHRIVELDRQITQDELQIQTHTKEKENLLLQLAELRQEIIVLRQDKEYLTRQNNDIQQKYYSAEEKISILEASLDETKRAKEVLYEKHISTRDAYKTEYENKLAVELEQLRSRTALEIDKLRESIKEMYERENRTYQHTRDEAIAERDRHIQLERDLQRKYDELLNEYRQYKSTIEVRLGELQSELKLKTFEFDRLQLLYEENLKSLKTTQIEIEKLQKKNDLIQKEYFNLQVQSDRRIMEVDTELNEKRTKLQVYEKVEQELDEVVMQAAQVENDADADKILFSYGYGASLPTTAKRRLQHSVHLAKRVIQLEQANTSLRLELDRERKKKTDIQQELGNANKILDQAQQPYDFLIATVRNKDAQLKKVHDTIEQLEKQLRECENERQSLIKTNNQLTKDIEKLLEYQEPLKVMKTVIMNLQHQDPQKPTHRSPSPPLTKKYRSLTPPTHQSRRSVGFVEQLDQHHNPPPTVFTSTSNAKSPSTRVIRGPPASQQGKYRKIYKVTNN
ncbi:unnamed protein product [Rotaria sordida]|uniref:Progesterone-induced-blocking factor 1 n=1 Tax=Rotaria sordida TaxID=392033 RepID=A0A815J912_9BILA|nr:unnamed protein product [Rotaria sordida]CAF1054553.1 unnamed protein product [Rotaria sordida]CAF1092463.1 unnamed protein product [Rotaria sordida]CAF1175972.1 unnamed protein product [Rotaria sordida]CAF1335576.1 unnamed protein product [Rotaria sordida]